MQLDAMAGTSIGSSDPKVVGDARRMATRDDVGHGWYPECGGHMFGLERLSAEEKARQDKMNSAAFQEAEEELAAESITVWAQLVRFLFGGAQPDQHLQEPLKWRVATTNNGLCAIAKRQAGSVGVCFTVGGRHARTVDVDLKLLKSVDECAWNTEGNLLACCCHGSAQVIVLRVNVATQSVSKVGQLVELGGEHGVVASIHFRSSSELVVISNQACILRVAVSGEPDVRPLPPTYFVGNPGVEFSRTLNIGGGAVQRTALWKTKSDDVFFGPKGGDVLTLACDENLFLILLLDSAPYFERIRELPIRAPGDPSPPGALGFLTPLGISRIPQRERVVQLALSPTGQYLASLTRGGRLIVRYSGLQFNAAAPTDLGNAVVARSDVGETVLDVAWWDEHHLILAKKETSSSYGKLALVPLEDPLPKTSLLVETLDSRLSRPMSLAAAGSRSSSALAFALTCDKQWIPQDEQRPPNATILKGGYLLLRHYRLSAIVGRSPPELYKHYLQKADFEQAQILLDNFGLDADLMTKAQWENASPKTTVHIRQTLALVKDLDWVLDQCVNQLPFSEDAVRALLDLGIERCTQSETSLSESQTSIMREIENLRYRLDVFLAIRGEQGYEAVEFSIFRTQDIARIAREAAEEGHVGTVHKLVSAFPVDLAPELLSVLSCFPETTSPMEYADILPAYDPTISANVYQILGADGSVKPIANMDPLPFVVSRLETIAEWYTHRILEIDQASGMLDLALELSQCANVRLESCAADPAGVQLNLLVQNTRDLDRLVYQTGLRDTLTLSSWNMMDEYARLCVAVDGTTSNSIVKVMSARALPWYRNLQPPPLITWLGHVRRYLRARSRGLEDPRDMPVSGTPVSNDGAYIAWDLDSAREGIALCAEVIYQSRPLSVNEGGLPRQDRLIPLSTALIETALACCYACPVPDARTSFDKIFQSLPARQPEIESKVPALAALQDRVELLDTHLDVNSQLETFASAVPLQFFVDCCQADEARRAEKLLASGIPQEESKTLEQLMTNDQNIEDTRWMIGDGHSEASGPYTPAAEQERVSEDDRNEVLSAGLNSKRAESEPGAALVLRVLDQASKHEGADRKYWDQALAAVWSLRKALPYLSRRFIARQCLFTLLRAGQFDVAHELIIDMDEAAGENSILSREEMEELVIEVSQEYFNSSADYGSQEMAKAKQVLKTLPFAASQRVQTEANLVQILDLLSNQLGAPMVPLQVRMFIASESPEEIIDKVLEANPTLYKSDSKLLRLAYLMGLDAPDQSASIRLRVLKAALSHHDLETAQRLVVSMVEKANVLLEGNKTPAVERTAQVSAEACLHLANSGLLKQLDDSKKYALHALLLARDGETSRDALATMESIETPENSDVALANLPWVSVFEGDSGMVSFRKLRRACPVAWATSELAHNPHLATMALAEIISYNPDAIVQVDECLDYLQQAMQSPEASSKQTQIIHSALRAVAVAATASSDAPVAILQEPPSKVLRRLSSYLPTLKEKDDDLHRLAQRLCENCKALSDNHSLLRLLPHANIALFKSDEKYRKRSLMDAARALGHAFEPLDGASWLGLVELAEECGGASRWDLDAARVAGLILSGAPVKEIESQLRKDDGLTRLLEQRAATQSMLSKLWRGIDGTNYEQLLIVENLMLRALDDDSNEEEHKRLKDRRAFLRRIEKLAYHPNAKLFLCMPLAENETVDRETALVEIDRLMDKKNVKRLAKLLSSNVECLPKLRPSEIVLHFCCHLLGVGSSTMDQNSQVPRNLLTEVTQSAAMAGRQTYKSSCAELVHILVPIDIVSLAQRCAALGGVLDLLDLDLRETIIQDCRTALLSAINRKPVDNADELLATLNQAGAFLQGIRFLLENLDLDRPNSTQLINNLEKSGLSADLIQMAFEGAALSGGCSAEVLVHACAAMEMSPVTMFHDISNHVLNQPDTSMDEISALVSITSYLIDLQSDDERATGESMLRALREFTSESSSEKLRIDVLKLLSLAGLDQDGDQELMQNLKALRSVQDIWPLTLTSDIHIDQVGSVQQRCELLKDLGCPEDATSRLRVAHLLLEWEALSAEKLPFGDFYHSVQFHAQKVASGLITKYVSPEVPLSSQVDFTSRLSAYSEVWEGLFQIAAENNEKEFLNSIRYSIDGIALLSEAAENDLSQTHDLPVFGLFSGYYKVRTSAETSLWKQDAIDLDNDDDLVQLVLVTCILTTVPSELLQPLSERSLKLAQFSNISSQPLAWSPIYLALIFCLRGEFVEAGQVILHANNTPKLMCSGSAWHVALRHAIMQASLCEIQGLGWEFAAELASVALMRFNESCCQDRQESSSFLSFLKQASKVVESHEEVESGDNWDDSWDNEDANARPDVQSNVAKIDPGKSEVNSISGWQVEDDDLDFGEGDKSLTKETLIQSALQDTTQTADTNTGWGGDDEDNLDFEEDDKGSAGETLNQSAMRDPVHASTITGSGTGWGKDEDEDLSFEEDDKASAGESLLQSAMRDPAQASTDAGTGTGPGWGDDEDEDLSFEEDDKGSAGESLNQRATADSVQASRVVGTSSGCDQDEDEDASSGGDVSNCLTSHTSHTFSEHQDQIPNSIEGNYLEDKRSVHDNKLRLDGHNDDETTTEKKCIQTTMDGAVVEDYLPSTTSGWPNGDEDGSDLDFSEAGESSLRPEAISSPSQTDMETLKLVASGQQNVNFNVAKDFKTNMAPNDDPPVTEEGQASNVVDDESDFDMNGSSVVMDFSKEGAGDSMVHSSASIIANGRPQKEDADLSIEEPKSSNDDLCLQDDLISRSQDQILETNEAGGEQIGKYPGSSLTRCVNNSEGKETSHMESDVPTFEVGESKTVSNLAAQTSTSSDATGWASEGEDDLDVVEKNYSGSNDDSAQTLMSTGAQALAPLGGAGWVDDDDADDVEFDQEASGTYESSLQDEGHKEGEALHVDQASRLSSMLSADWVDDGSDEDDTDNAHFTSESGNQKSFPIDPPANISSENTAEDSEVDIDELLEFSGQKESHTESDLQVALNSGSWEDESDDLNFGREDPELSEEVEVVDDSDKINREEEPYSNDTADEYSSDKEPGWESDQHDFHADIDSKLSEKELTVSSVEEAVEAGQVALFSNDHDAAVAQNSENEQNPAENAIQDFITTSFQSGDTGCLEHEEPKDKPAETSSIQGDDEHKNSLAKFVGLGKQEEQEEEEDAFHQSEVIHENEEHDGITKLSCEQKKCDEANAEVQVAKDIDDKEASEAAKEISSLNVSYPPVHASDEVSEVSKSSFDDSVSNAEGPEPPLSSVTIVSNHQMRSMVEDEGYIGLSDEGEEPVKKVEDCEEFGNNQNSLNTIADNADDSCNPKEAPSTDDNESGLFDQGCEALKDRQISKGGWDDQSSLGDIDEEDAVVDGTSQEASNDTTYEGELFEQDDDLLKESTGVEGGWEDQSSLGDIDGDAENCDTMKATNNDAKQAEVFQPDDESLKDSKKSERAWEDQSSLGDVDVIDADSVQVSSTDAPAETFLRDDTSRGVTRHSTSDLSDGLAPTAITGESSGWQDNESDIDAGSVSSRSSHASVTVRQMPSSEAEISTGRDAEYHSFPAETMHGAPSAENGANASGDIDDLAIGGNASTMDRLARGLEGIDLSQDFPSPSSADHSSPAEGATGHSNSSQEDLAGEGTASSFQEHQHVASTDHDGGLESSEIQHRVTSTNAGGAHGGADHNASEVTFEERRQGFFEDENEDEEYSSSESNLDRTSEEVRELGTIVADENGDTNEARLAREDVAHDEVHEDDIHQSAGVEAGMELEQRQHEGGVAFEEHDPVSEIGTLTDNYGGEDDAEEAHSTTTAGEPAESGDFGSPRLLSVHARQQLREHFNAGEGSASSPFATYGGGNVNYSDDDAEAAAINASNSIAADNTENSVVEGVEARNSSSTAEDGAQETSDFGDTLTVRAGGSTGEELNGLEQLENSNDLVDAGEQTFANTRQRGGLEQSVHDVVVNEADPGDAWGLNDDLDSDGSDYGISAFGVPLGEAESNGHEETREFLHSASEQGRNLGGDVTRSQAARPHRTQSGQLPYDTTDFERLAESSHQESSAEVSPNLVASFMQEHELHREASAQSAGDQESGERGDNDNSNLANQSGWEDEDLDL